jgi:ATP-dependent protease ClpP protease subunit
MEECPRYDELLIPRHAVLISGEIDEHLYEHVQPMLLSYALESAETVTVLIDCQGGDVRVGLRLYDYIRAMPGTTRGVVIGRCWSMALPVLQACTLRAATEHSTFLLHEVRCNVRELLRSKKSTFNVLMKDSLESQRHIEKIIVSRSRFTLRQLRSYMHEGEENHVELSAAHAKKLGLIDRIISHPFGPIVR